MSACLEVWISMQVSNCLFIPPPHLPFPLTIHLQNGTCFIKEVPFRGVNCSDAAGKEYPYSYMVSTLEANHAQYHWDKNSLSPWFNVKVSSK